jgi:hypothetical protein
MAFGDQDLDIFFQDGTQVYAADGSALFMAHLDLPEKLEQFGVLHSPGGQQVGHPQIRFSTAAAPAAFGRGTVVIIKGVRYQLRSDPDKQGDGLESVAELKLATS